MTVRPADLIEDQLPEIREEIKEYAKSDEDVLMYASSHNKQKTS